MTFEPKENPDVVIECIPEISSSCGTISLNEGHETVEKRQIIEIPVVLVQPTEFHICTCTCPNCDSVNRWKASEHVTQEIQSDISLTAIVVYLSVFQLLPSGEID